MIFCIERVGVLCILEIVIFVRIDTKLASQIYIFVTQRDIFLFQIDEFGNIGFELINGTKERSTCFEVQGMLVNMVPQYLIYRKSK